MTTDRGYRYVVASFLAAVLAGCVLAFVPLGTSVTETAVPADDTGAAATEVAASTTRHTLVASEGWGGVAAIVVPVLVASGVPLLVTSGRGARLVRGASAVLLATGTVLGILSVGVFLLPSAVLMLVATVTTGPRREAPGLAPTASP